MYEQYFGFTRTPFRLESEPDMFFFGESQKNVLNCIKKSLSLRKGLITLSGLPGSGKTTVMRRAIEESIMPDSVICRINRARCSDFFETLKQEISARQKQRELSSADTAKASKKTPSHESQVSDLHQLVKIAVEEEKHFLIVIDESQQLTEAEVDVLFSLVSIEKNSRKHFKFLLVSHEPFRDYFDISQYDNSDELLSTHCLLLPLLNEEILPYIEHRLGNTGWTNSPSFSREIEYLVFLITQGIPRRINSFFDRLMLFSYFEKNRVIDTVFIKSFCRDLLVELDSQPHPDLDSFDLRQALRREQRLFDDNFQKNIKDAKKEDTLLDEKQGYQQSKNNISTSSFDIDEPLASEDPEEILLFVSSFIKNPERYKNYTDQYYQIPKSLTLLLCLATESDRYIDDITPVDLSSSSPADIKSMIIIFVEKMLITSRFNEFRILGLDAAATDDEINRHFSYMMRICRSDYVKSNREEFEAIIKKAYITLLSHTSDLNDEIPIVDDVLVMPNEQSQVMVIGRDIGDHINDEEMFDHSAIKKMAELDNAKRILNESSPAAVSNKIADDSADEKNMKNKSRMALPLSIAGLAIAAGMGYLFIGTGLLSPVTPVNENDNQPHLIAKMPQVIEGAVTVAPAAVNDKKLMMLNEVKTPSVQVANVNNTANVAKETQAVKVVSAVNVKAIEASENTFLIKEAILQEEKAQKEKPQDKSQEKKSKTNDAGIIAQANAVSLVAAPRQAINVIPKESKRLFDKIELERIVNNYKYGYESGDTDELATLFSEHAVTNEGFNREQIIEDYEMLFDESYTRSVIFKNVVWDQNKDFALGLGKFKIVVNGEESVETEGEISIKVIKVDDAVQIKQLFFLYQFAEIE